MSTYKTRKEKIAHYKKKAEALQQTIEELETRDREVEEKRRTHRLITVGAEVESVLGHPIEKKDLPKLRKFLEDQEKRGKWFSKAMNKELETPTQTPPTPQPTHPPKQEQPAQQPTPQTQQEQEVKEEEVPDLSPTEDMPF